MKKLFVLLSLFFSSVTFAACPQLYPNNVVLTAPGTVELCNSFFVNQFNVSNRAVIFASERLVVGTDVGKETRVNAFHPDPRLKNSPKPAEYTGTSHDRGHMSPAGDSSSPAQMYETFLMSNMSPQEPTLNRESWRILEENVRKDFAHSKKDVWVLTIAVYPKNGPRISQIPIPSGYWKIVYLENQTKYFFAENKPNAKVSSVNAVDVKQLIANAGNF